MAKEKSSFILYYDFEEQTATLTDEQVGRLIRVMLDYEKRGALPDREDMLVEMAFWFLKVGLDVNDEKYRKVCERNRANRNGGVRQASPVVTSGTDTEPYPEPETEWEAEGGWEPKPFPTAVDYGERN